VLPRNQTARALGALSSRRARDSCGTAGRPGSTDLLTYRFGSIENPFVIMRRSLSVAVIATLLVGTGRSSRIVDAKEEPKGRTTLD
jgi:hypothetical protein